MRPAFSLAEPRPNSPSVMSEAAGMRGIKKYRRSESDRLGLEAGHAGAVEEGEDIDIDMQDIPPHASSSTAPGYAAMRQRPMAFHTSIDEESAWPEM